MTLQFKTRHCNSILLRGFDVSLQFHNCQVCTYFCVCKCLLFQFIFLKGCPLCMLQFSILIYELQEKYKYKYIYIYVYIFDMCNVMQICNGHYYYLYSYLQIYVYMYVCIYACIYACLYVCMCVYMYEHVHMQHDICKVMQICNGHYYYLYSYLQIYVYMYVCIYACMYACLYICMCVYMCIYICMNIFLSKYICMKNIYDF